MRLATFRGPDGNPRSGAVIGADGSERIVDLAQATAGRVPTGDLLGLLQAGPSALAAARAAADAGGGQPLGSVELLAPIRRPGKLLAVAGNFQAHIEEGGGQRVDKTKIVPKLFIKPSSAIIGPGEPVALPTVSNALDWELELAIVIGTAGRDIPLAKARDHIAGYSVINDISARSMQWGVEGREPGGFDDFFDWLNGKWGDGFAAWGPYITTTDSVSPDPNNLEMTLKVNEKVWQHGSTSDMIFSPEEIIAFASRWMTLEPGDVIAGGTLDGTGDAAGVYLNEGDVMIGTIGDLGTLITPVVAATNGKG
jgi:2-keto-4-pentenoate hydratase/2-oxohepta-3-ene-1,7-dioic acid hydratase in catechol pathway